MSMLTRCRNKLCDGLKNGMDTVVCSNNNANKDMLEYQWAVEYQCQICDAKYYSCKICDNDLTRKFTAKVSFSPSQSNSLGRKLHYVK